MSEMTQIGAQLERLSEELINLNSTPAGDRWPGEHEMRTAKIKAQMAELDSYVEKCRSLEAQLLAAVPKDKHRSFTKVNVRSGIITSEQLGAIDIMKQHTRD